MHAYLESLAEVAINRFVTDTDAEIQAVIEQCKAIGIPRWFHRNLGKEAMAQ